MAPKDDFLTFNDCLQVALTEEDVKNYFASTFGIKYDTSDRIDLYTLSVLFEFKLDGNFGVMRQLAPALAQTLYYMRRLKYGVIRKGLPPYICIANRSQALIIETSTWSDYITNANYDWDLPSSSPDPILCRDLEQEDRLKAIHLIDLRSAHAFGTFRQQMVNILAGVDRPNQIEKKVIDEYNFEDVYAYWNEIFGDAVRNGLKPSKYFVADIQEGNSLEDRTKGQVVFRFTDGNAKVKKILFKQYDYFWSLYERVTDPATIRGIIAKVDRLTDDFERRFHGEFFTPLNFARKSLQYLEALAGNRWWLDDNIRLWDMAAGTGNLEYYLPADALPKCYLSTLYSEEVEHCQLLFPGATTFQYDYLNDDVANVLSDQGHLPLGHSWKMPQQLRNDLRNPDIRWIILINPPFATAQTAGTNKKRSKTDVSNTHVRTVMHDRGLGETSRELFAQFLFRIKNEFEGKNATLGLFATLKYINANNDHHLRDKIFKFRYLSGFIFPSQAFAGVKGFFPIGCLFWNLNEQIELKDQIIETNIYGLNEEKLGVKRFMSYQRDSFLSKWIVRPRTKQIFPPFGAALSFAPDNKDVRNKIAPGFLASLMMKGNDFQNQNYTAFLSGPYISAGGISVTSDNFEQAMVVHTVRRLPKANWLNDRDQFLQPNQELDPGFIADCVVWSLFSGSNQTVAIRSVQYLGTNFTITNQFYPFLLQSIRSKHINDDAVRQSLMTAEDRYAATWLAAHEVSDLATAVMSAGQKVYDYFYANLPQLNTTKYQIQTWDVGWYQVSQALKDQQIGLDLVADLRQTLADLAQTLEVQIREYGFLG